MEMVEEAKEAICGGIDRSGPDHRSLLLELGLGGDDRSSPVEMGWNGTGSVRSVISELSRAGNANRKALACGLSAAKPATARVEFRAV
uniref:Uncharacterized protein n=1 Tax=Globodera rostochiensis TaxID=31243 RepID=A0A914GX01_GLORO